MRIVEQIHQALHSHGNWKVRLKQAIDAGESTLSVADIQKDNLCDFGKWLYGDDIPEDAKFGMYNKVVGLHARFHIIASEVIALTKDGKTEEAQQLMDTDYNKVSVALTTALMEWKREVLKS